MNTIVTSRDEIMKNCRELVSENGLSALNMRAVAQKCNVALGSLYNYFPSKNDLMIATIESVWQDIFQMKQPCHTELSFTDYIQWVFESVRAGMIAYPNFFTAHSIGFASEDKGQARQSMDNYFQHMKQGLLATLEHDPAVRENAFDESFPPAEFIDFVLAGILSLLMQRKPSCTVLLKMIYRTIY